MQTRRQFLSAGIVGIVASTPEITEENTLSFYTRGSEFIVNALHNHIVREGMTPPFEEWVDKFWKEPENKKELFKRRKINKYSGEVSILDESNGKEVLELLIDYSRNEDTEELKTHIYHQAQDDARTVSVYAIVDYQGFVQGTQGRPFRRLTTIRGTHPEKLKKTWHYPIKHIKETVSRLSGDEFHLVRTIWSIDNKDGHKNGIPISVDVNNSLYRETIRVDSSVLDAYLKLYTRVIRSVDAKSARS